MNWSKPYYGVAHLLDVERGRGYVTVDERKSFTEAYVLRSGSFTPIAEIVFYGPDATDKARAWAEEKARMFDLVKAAR